MVDVSVPPLISFLQVNEVAVEDIRPRPQGSSPVYEYSVEEEYLKVRILRFYPGIGLIQKALAPIASQDSCVMYIM